MEDIQRAQDALVALRSRGHAATIVAFGTYAGSTDTPDGHVSVTVEDGGYSVTKHAVHLRDALSMAEHKLAADAKARADEAAGKPRKGGRPRKQEVTHAA